MRFRDRDDAGRRLAARVLALHLADPVVLALPRGGGPVAAQVARAIGAPLDVILVRKLGVPTQPELAMGALGEEGVRVLARDNLARAHVRADQLADVERRERDELARRARTYRGDREPLPITGRTVVIVDDGLATGASARAAVEVARARGAGRVVLAVPVAPPETVAALRANTDDVVSLETPAAMAAIGQWYDDFSQTSDAEVVAHLEGPRP
jgi:predicted phosphoribosyltransferase